MNAPTRVQVWDYPDVEERIGKALEIMERLDVDELHWEAVFAAVAMMLSQAQLQIQQDIPLAIDPRVFRGK